MLNFVTKLNKTTLAIDKITYINKNHDIKKIVKSGTRKFVLLKNKPDRLNYLQSTYLQLNELDATDVVVASVSPLSANDDFPGVIKTEFSMGLDSTGNLEILDSTGSVIMGTLVEEPDEPEEPTNEPDPDQPFEEAEDSLKDFIPEYINIFHIQIGIVEKF